MAASAIPFLQRPEVKTYGLSILLILVGLLLLGALAWPTWGKIQELREDINGEEERIVLLKEKVEDLLNFSDQQTLLDEKFVIFERAITLESKIPDLLTKIQDLSEGCNLSVKTLQYSGEGGADGVTGRVRPIRVRYSAEGSFSNLTCLTAALESSSRIMDVESFQYRSSRTEAGALRLSPELILLGYYTAPPILNPDNPLTFSFTSPGYLQAETILGTLK